FFQKAYELLPDDGRMLLHTILAHTQKFFRDNGIKVTISDLKFMKFIEQLALDSGFTLERIHLLQHHYARTLDMWAAKLVANRDEAVAITSTEIYDRYMKYLTGCADFFRRGITNIGQFTLVKG
ncbi:class I SAM-dependent methyltransferase, partial [Mycolicibacterium gadium]|uniref:class I SAM-dependent methyltransferase n=1 Tax=Mycolicibacterium gadium TaxID=1794 RepID=UPI0021F251FA